MIFFWYLIALMAAYRITYLVTQEDGPLDVFALLQERLNDVPVLGKLISCFYCLSFWFAVPASLWLASKYELSIFDVLLAALSISGICVWLFDANTRGEG